MITELKNIFNITTDEGIDVILDHLGRGQRYQRLKFYHKNTGLFTYNEYQTLMHNIIERVENTDYFRNADTLHNGVYRISLDLKELSPQQFCATIDNRVYYNRKFYKRELQ